MARGINALIACLLYFSLGFCDCRTAKQQHHRLSFSRSIDTEDSVHLPSIVDELKTEDFDVEVLPYFQRIAVSGEEMSGVSVAIFAKILA